MTLLHYLLVENFRNHAYLEFESGAKFVSILGKNGSGKTSLLEAVSLLAPGKGIKNAMLDDILQDNKPSFAVHAKTQEDTIAMQYDNITRKKRFLINDTAGKISENFDILPKILWLTPSMDASLSSSKSERRKLFDRITYNFIPKHAQNISKYEKLQASRIKILKDRNPDALWLDKIEMMLATQALEILKDRVMILNKVNSNKDKIDLMPVSIEIEHPSIEKLHDSDFIYSFAKELLSRRKKDAILKKTTFGVQNIDYKIVNCEKSQPAYQCSTGEQKAMLISIFIAQTIALNEMGIQPILLLDDIVSHLDNQRILLLFKQLSQLDTQIWMTAITLPDAVQNIIHDNVKKLEI